ncbi:uncharacterized protein [Palaemon carinicauda]|uniref:uncharacterized protein n=1 Tax=Palaemon carinicauda TaxID=392227 RepID=UPI0035B671C0
MRPHLLLKITLMFMIVSHTFAQRNRDMPIKLQRLENILQDNMAFIVCGGSVECIEKIPGCLRKNENTSGGLVADFTNCANYAYIELALTPILPTRWQVRKLARCWMHVNQFARPLLECALLR